MTILGIDLAGKQENPSGIAILDGNKMKLFTSYSDDEILDLVDEVKPQVIVIDAHYHFQRVDVVLRRIANVQLEGIFVKLKGIYVNMDEYFP
jgi:hypothetical protein